MNSVEFCLVVGILLFSYIYANDRREWPIRLGVGTRSRSAGFPDCAAGGRGGGGVRSNEKARIRHDGSNESNRYGVSARARVRASAL